MADDTDHLVTLIIAQDNLHHSWMKLLVTVQAGLIVILGFLLRPIDSGNTIDPVLHYGGGIAISAFGIIFATAIWHMVKRERQWAGWYVQKSGIQA